MRINDAWTRQLVASLCCFIVWLFMVDENYDVHRNIKQYSAVPHYFVVGYTVIVTNPLNLRRLFDQNMNHVAQTTSIPIHQRQQRQRMELPMCICINCARVLNCSAYHFVESKHEQPHITEQPTFTPRDGSPTIHVNIRTERSTSDTGNRTWSEEVKIAHSATISVGDATTTDKAQDAVPVDLLENGDMNYSSNIIPITSSSSYEYDVVKCVDYVEDMNCWIRNMPDEIKRANPNFVPT